LGEKGRLRGRGGGVSCVIPVLDLFLLFLLLLSFLLFLLLGLLGYFYPPAPVALLVRG
jgi:hypothetical protein